MANQIQKLRELFFEFGHSEINPIYIGSRRLQKFADVLRENPEKCFSPETMKIFIDEKGPQYYGVLGPNMDLINSSFIAGVIKGNNFVHCYRCFIRDEDLLKTFSPAEFSDKHRLSGTMGEIAMLLKWKYKIHVIPSSAFCDEDLISFFRYVMNRNPTQAEMDQMRNEKELQKSIYMIPPETTQVISSYENFCKVTEAAVLLRSSKIVNLAERQRNAIREIGSNQH